VLIVDDQMMVREGFSVLLNAMPGIEVVGEAVDGRQAIAQVAALRPDVVLMDIRMPVLDGLEAARRVLARQPDCRVLMLTTFDLDRYVYAALALGASGFLLKDVTAAHLAAAVRLVDTGDALLSPSITRRLVERFAADPPSGTGPGGSAGPAGPAPAVHRDLAALTPRELEVLTMLGRGLSNSELARQLTLSEATVKTHVARIFAKLTLRDRAQAVVLAYETGLVAPGQ